MIYNINLGIGWASSGVEYAQSYRAAMLRNIGQDAKFVFTDLITYEHIEHMTKNIGFLDSEVIWLYMYFTDFKMTPVTYTKEQLEQTFGNEKFTYTRDGKIGRYVFEGTNNFYTAYFTKEDTDLVHRVELVSNGCLIRKDYFTYGRVFSEYYAPLDNKAHLYLRRFFNEDGSVAYEEINDDGNVMYQFKDQLICSKEEFVGYFVKSLNLTNKDVVIIDRTTGIGQAILMNVKDARVGIVIHADHFAEGSTDDDYILWNNYYEYPFAMHKHIDFYIAATNEQSNLFKRQFEKYMHVSPTIYTIPVGSLKELKYPSEKGRKPYSVITASRLATEKHVDWTIEAVVKAHEVVPDITFDIYGQGGEKDKLEKLIKELNAESYIKLCGQQKLDEIYQNYEVYLSGSTSEGFGLSLMEAIGGGLPIIGFDVRYGNPTFIDEGENGYLIEIDDNTSIKEKIDALADRLVKTFTEANLEAFHKHSYEVASGYLTSEVEKKWKTIME
jgi:poly(glycerol-phosphate) alpha-glucosyltransferase